VEINELPGCEDRHGKVVKFREMLVTRNEVIHPVGFRQSHQVVVVRVGGDRLDSHGISGAIGTGHESIDLRRDPVPADQTQNLLA